MVLPTMVLPSHLDSARQYGVTSNGSFRGVLHGGYNYGYPVDIYPFSGQPLRSEVLSFEWKISGNRCKYVRYTCPNEAKKLRWGNEYF